MVRKDYIKLRNIPFPPRQLSSEQIKVPMTRTLSDASTQHQNEPPHDKTNKMTYTLSEDSDQPGLISLRYTLSG